MRLEETSPGHREPQQPCSIAEILYGPLHCRSSMQYNTILQLGCCLVPSKNPYSFDKQFRFRENKKQPPSLLLRDCMFSCRLQRLHLSFQHLHACLLFFWFQSDSTFSCELFGFLDILVAPLFDMSEPWSAQSWSSSGWQQSGWEGSANQWFETDHGYGYDRRQSTLGKN